MKLPVLLQCHENAFAFFGGWTRAILYDNMKQVRLTPAQLQPQFLTNESRSQETVLQGVRVLTEAIEVHARVKAL